MSAAPMDFDWRTIQEAARAQALAEIAELERTPIAFGDYIAWTVCQFGLTAGLSHVHRVGFPKGNDPYTTCGEAIPHPMRWLPLSPAMVKTMDSCRFCEAEYARATNTQGNQGHAA